MSLISEIINLSSDNCPENAPADPEANRVAKFMIISSEDRLAFVYGLVDEFAYHAELVKRYCDLNNIPSGWTRKPDLYSIYNKAWRLKGGGWLEERPGQKLLRFYGYSTAYGPFDAQDIPYLFENDEKFSGYIIAIDE